MKSSAKNKDKKYEAYVEHPRYGKYPRHTGLNPNPYDSAVQLHPNATNIHEVFRRTKILLGDDSILGFMRDFAAGIPDVLKRIPGTSIRANPAKQITATVPVTHYFDVERVCRNCKRPFIFFAEEQAFWFEELGFTLDADCIRCHECRKQDRSLARNRATYEKLLTSKTRDEKELLTMADCALTLVEHGVFKEKVLQRVAALLKCASESTRRKDIYANLMTRLKTARTKVAV